MARYARGGTAALFVSLALQAVSVSDAITLRQGLLQWTSGTQAASISGDGHVVAFVSTARLVAADVNALHDIYVFDRRTGVLTLETAAADGSSADGSSLGPRLSGDGRYLVFESVATNLTATPDVNGRQDVFVRDRLAAATRCVSKPTAGSSNANSGPSDISDDGRFVAFVSAATNLVPGEDASGASAGIYVVSVENGAIVRVSVDANGRPFVDGGAPSLSADGRFVAFSAWGRAPNPRRGSAVRTGPHVYVRDVAASATACVSCGRDGEARGPFAFAPDISGDGRIVVFAVQTTPLRSDVAMHDRSLGRTVVITRAANARSTAPRVAANGRFVVFESWASDLLCRARCSEEEADENVLGDVYVFDGELARFARASGSRRQWWAPSLAPAIDGSGRTIAFISRQPFGPEDGTSDFDLYVCFPVCR
jgi:Tol biopolymer transport system component